MWQPSSSSNSCPRTLDEAFRSVHKKRASQANRGTDRNQKHSLHLFWIPIDDDTIQKVAAWQCPADHDDRRRWHGAGHALTDRNRQRGGGLGRAKCGPLSYPYDAHSPQESNLALSPGVSILLEPREVPAAPGGSYDSAIIDTHGHVMRQDTLHLQSQTQPPPVGPVPSTSYVRSALGANLRTGLASHSRLIKQSDQTTARHSRRSYGEASDSISPASRSSGITLPRAARPDPLRTGHPCSEGDARGDSQSLPLQAIWQNSTLGRICCLGCLAWVFGLK